MIRGSGNTLPTFPLLVLQDVMADLLPHAMKGDTERYLSDATLFLEMFGIVVVACVRGWTQPR